MAMDAFSKALQPVSEPNFVDDAFKVDPKGTVFNEWQGVDSMLDSEGRQLEAEDALNHGGSSQGSQTAMDSHHRRVFSAGLVCAAAVTHDLRQPNSEVMVACTLCLCYSFLNTCRRARRHEQRQQLHRFHKRHTRRKQRLSSPRAYSR